MIRNVAAAAGVTTVGALTSGLAAVGSDTGRAFGAPRTMIAERTARSERQVDGVFANREPASPIAPDRDTAWEMLRKRGRGRPARTVPVRTPEFATRAAPLAVTWLGHATALVELDGVRVLTDPVLSQRCSPSPIVGPARMHTAPCTAAQLPSLDVVLLSHDHYDHLDMTTVCEIARRQPATAFVAPIGVGAHLEYWGVDPARVVEADWGERLEVAGLIFDCVAARHFSGRGLVRNLTQWASWGVRGAEHSMFFVGDTGFTESYADAGARLGPWDLTLVPIGAYDAAWPDIHVNPEEAVRLHTLLCGDSADDTLMLPIHWATFNLALHGWDEPVTRLLAAAQTHSVPTITPPPGARIDVTRRTGPGVEDSDWWRAIG